MPDSMDRDSIVKEMSQDILNNERSVQEEELFADQTFVQSAKMAYRAVGDEDFKGTDQEAVQMGLDMASRFNYNITGMGVQLAKMNDASDDDKLAMLYIVDTLDKKDMTWDGAGRAIREMALDPMNYVFGAGVGARIGTKVATGKGVSEVTGKAMLKDWFKKVYAHKYANPAMQGGLMETKAEAGRQKLEIEAHARDGYSAGELATAGAIGTVAGAGIMKATDMVAEGGRKLIDYRRSQPNMPMRTGGIPTSLGQGSVDDILAQASTLEGGSRQKLLNKIDMRNISPEDKKKVIEFRKANAPEAKPKSVKAQEQIKEAEAFNSHFYSKLENEANKIPNEQTFTNIDEAKTFLQKQGVRADEMDSVLNADALPEGEFTGRELRQAVRSREDTITKRTYDSDSSGTAIDQDEWDYGISESEGQVDVGEQGYGIRLYDENSGAEGQIGYSFDDEVYVDDYGTEFDYDSLKDDWFENYGEDHIEQWHDEMVEAGVDMADPDEVRANVIALAEDEGIMRDNYYSKTVYELDDGSIHDTLDEAKARLKDNMYEDFNYYREEEGAEIYEDYTVSGGDDYKLEVYQLEDFTSEKPSHREPHFGSLEHGDENVQVHARMKTRTDANNKQGTVLEEVQSQWEQDWRSQGGGTKPRTTEQQKALDDKLAEAEKKYIDSENLLSDHQLKTNHFSTIDKMQKEATAIRKSYKEEAEKLREEIIQSGDERTEMLEEIVEQAHGKYNYDERYIELNKELEEMNKPIIKMDKETRLRKAEFNTARNNAEVQEPSMATPPLKNRTQYTKLAMMDNLLKGIEKDQDYFGWINGHIQNGSRIETTQGMSQAYDIEMPRIIQKTTGETPYMARFDNGESISSDQKLYWDKEEAKDLESFSDTADIYGLSDDEWYWRVDFTPELKKKLKDAKIQMYGLTGVSLLGASQAMEENNKADNGAI